MITKELIEIVADDCNMSQKKCKEIITDAVRVITCLLHEEALFSVAECEDEPVRINGLGTFKITRNKERKGRNPRTGEKIVIPAKNRVIFKASRLLKKAINE